MPPRALLGPRRPGQARAVRVHARPLARIGRVVARYEGYLVADAQALYDHLYADETVTEVSCWGHARRYFFEAMSSDPGVRARRWR